MATLVSYFPNSLHLSTISPKSRNFKFICCVSSNNNNAKKQTSTTNLRVIFAAGGTGGHIYPAVAIADELKALNPNAQILFVGNTTGMETTAIPSAGYDFISVTSHPLVRPLISLQNFFIFPYLLTKSLIETRRVIQNFSPQIVIGTGGYVSFPTCLAAVLAGLKLIIHEQNSVPGIANWALSFFADKIFVAFNSTVNSFPIHKCIVSGNPIRPSLKHPVLKAEAAAHFFGNESNENSKIVLVLGGSLGANAINIALLYLYYQLLTEKEDLFIIWQTGVQAFDEMESLVKDNPRLILTPFLCSMDLAYAAADLIVSRAGAMTCSEILAIGRPAILIPSPNVAEGHQLKNAYLMADLAGSKVITEDELDSTTLRVAIEEIIENASIMATMSERALKAAKPNASAEIAREILSLVDSSTPKDK